MTKRKELFRFEVVTDCSSDVYHVGEVDYSMKPGAIEEFLRENGDDGWMDLIGMLAYFQYLVIDTNKRIADDVGQQFMDAASELENSND